MATKTAVKVTIKPIGNKVLVERDEAESQTEAGIYLPESAKDKPKSGVVRAVGTGALNHETGERVPVDLKKGDRVIFSSYAGTEIDVEGDKLLIMSEDEVLAVFD